jgi:Fe-S-cluster-containing hydrogenase component 2
VQAIIEEDGVYTVVDERCIGCGVCAPTCPTGSIALVRRPESEQEKPPADLIAWNQERASARGMEFKME